MLLTRDGRLRAVLGSPGGPTITTTVAQILMQLVDHDRTLPEAVRRAADPSPVDARHGAGGAGARCRAWSRASRRAVTACVLRPRFGHANCVEVDRCETGMYRGGRRPCPRRGRGGGVLSRSGPRPATLGRPMAHFADQLDRPTARARGTRCASGSIRTSGRIPAPFRSGEMVPAGPGDRRRGRALLRHGDRADRRARRAGQATERALRGPGLAGRAGPGTRGRARCRDAADLLRAARRQARRHRLHRRGLRARLPRRATRRSGPTPSRSSPYLGLDTLEPYFKEAGQSGGGVFVLIKTSNPGSGDLQDLQAGGERVWERVARGLAAPAEALRGPGRRAGRPWASWSAQPIPSPPNACASCCPTRCSSCRATARRGRAPPTSVRGLGPWVRTGLRGRRGQLLARDPVPRPRPRPAPRPGSRAFDAALDRAIDELGRAVA